MGMIIDHEREKLIESVKYFAQKTKKLGKVKLFKLLYFLDFTHFRDTGRPVTGLEYFAWKMGPVPKELFDELGQPGVDWQGNCAFRWVKTAKGDMLTVNALSEFNPTHFSKRELRLLRELSAEFRDADAEQMVEETHLENLPWHQIFEVEGRKQAQIPYLMSLKKQDYEFMLDSVRDRDLIVSKLRN
ncbi:hypothetical protein D3C85_907090 [compost metagenome]|uniref:Panacea domain-containing protein n=1 Tax=Pseudomonas cremoris TaxID=2724178 RepID=UPI000FA89C75|nr:Panacea domain-containing protein [Pseudomonas cremoris]